MNTLQITDSAKKELLRLITAESNPAKKLRIGVQGGGCSGLTYTMDFDFPNAQDIVQEMNGLEVLVNKAHALYLVGTTLDFEEGLNNRGFSFQNPNAKETCGCGTSFSV
jgi:iron-sulfur cluster assembly protein